MADVDVYALKGLPQNRLVRVVLSILAFFANVVAAAFGPTLLEGPISLVLKLVTHSPASMVIRAWICGVCLAGLLGATVARLSRTSTATWIWVAGLSWFLYGLSGGLGYPVNNPWLTFSGIACAERRGIPCMQFWSFTVLFVRCVSYSAGSFIVLRATADKPSRWDSWISYLLRALFLNRLPIPRSNEEVPKEAAHK